jgi:hypothetical protein
MCTIMLAARRAGRKAVTPLASRETRSAVLVGCAAILAACASAPPIQPTLEEAPLEGRTLDRCEPGRWCELLRVERRLLAVWAASHGAVFAVGDSGEIVWLDGRRWRSTVGPRRENLYGVWGSAPDDVWAVGGDPEVLHYDGRGWREVHHPAIGGLDLHAVHGSAADDVWIVGQYGIVVHYDGRTWTQRPSRFDGHRAFALWVLAPDDGWLAFDDGRMSRWDGARFSTFEEPHARVVNHVWAAAPDEVYLGELLWDGEALRSTEVSEATVIPAWRTAEGSWGIRPSGAPHPHASALYRSSSEGWSHELDASAIWGTPEGDLFAVHGGTIWGRAASHGGAER